MEKKGKKKKANRPTIPATTEMIKPRFFCVDMDNLTFLNGNVFPHFVNRLIAFGLSAGRILLNSRFVK